MTDEQLPWQRVTPLVYSVARSVFYKYKQYTEEDDIAQSIWVYWFEHETQLAGLLDDEKAQGVLRARLRTAGARYACREMAYRLGMDPDEQADYTRSEVRALVRFWLSGGPIGTENAETWAKHLDLQRGLNRLPWADWEVLLTAYGDEEREGMSSSERSKVWRVVRRLQDAMNTPVGA